jgi:hypothetical protein
MADPVANDFCTPLVGKILSAGPDAYRTLVVTRGTPAETRELLREVRPEHLLTAPPRSAAAAEAMLAGLWLWHDALEESHTISQGLGDATGSFWHAIMHRREGDFSNSKYWYARCRNHPAIRAVGDRAGEAFDPDTFVSRVSKVYEEQPDHPDYQAAVRIQRIEWQALFDHCVAAAAGGR